MSFLEALVPFALFLALVAYLRANGYYAEEVVVAPAPLCACNGVCVAPEVPVTSQELPPAVPATPARAPPQATTTPATPITAVRRPIAAASPLSAAAAPPPPAAGLPPLSFPSSPAAASSSAPAASPTPRTPNIWRNKLSTDKESVDSLLCWMSQRFLEGVDEEED